MNRSYRAPEREMPSPVAAKQPQMENEKEEELGLFMELEKRERELESRIGSSSACSIPSAASERKTGADDFLNSENDKNDYDWLLAPPDAPLFPSLEMGSENVVTSRIESPTTRHAALKSRQSDHFHQDPPGRSNLSYRRSISSPGLNTSSAGKCRTSASGGPVSRPATPKGLATSSTSSKPTLSTSRPASTPVSKLTRSSTPTPRSTTSTSMKSTLPARSSTPTARATARSSTPTARSTARSSTPSARATARPSTPTAMSTAKPSTSIAGEAAKSSAPPASSTARPSTPNGRAAARPNPSNRPTQPASKPISRALTPTRRPSLSTSTTSAPAKSPSTANSVHKTTKKVDPPPQVSFPTVKPRSWNPTEMPGFSLDAPPNLRTSLSDRPISATRGRAGAPTVRSSSVDHVPNGRVRRQSNSPSRGRLPSGNGHYSGSSVPGLNRSYAKANENVNPGSYGTKMVERVINMRKLLPPKHDDKHSPRSNLSGKSSSPDSFGFGRNLSKKSLDMAMRHMDIRQSVPSNLRPLMTRIPASSLSSLRSGSTRRTLSVSDSPLATSSNASSDFSVSNNSLRLNRSIDAESNSDNGVYSPSFLHGR